MLDWPTLYLPTLGALGTLGGLLLVQLLIADLAGIRSGHRPGTPVEPDPARFLFRAVRAHANTNESVAIFILLALFGVFSGASPLWLNGLAWTYLVSRVAHMLCYYAGWALARSASFAVSLLALFGMAAAGAAVWIG